MANKRLPAQQTTYSGRLGELSKRELTTLARSVPVTSHWALREYRLRFSKQNAPMVVTVPGLVATLSFFGVFLLPPWWLVVILLGPAALLSVLGYFALILGLKAVLPIDEHLVAARTAINQAKHGDPTAQNLAVELALGDGQYFGEPMVALPELNSSWSPRRCSSARFSALKVTVRQEFSSTNPPSKPAHTATESTVGDTPTTTPPGTSTWSKKLLAQRQQIHLRAAEHAAELLPLVHEVATLLDPVIDRSDDPLTRRDRETMRTDVLAAVEVYISLPIPAVQQPLTTGQNATQELTELLTTMVTTARTHYAEVTQQEAEQLAYLNRLNASRFKASNLDFD